MLVGLGWGIAPAFRWSARKPRREGSSMIVPAMLITSLGLVVTVADTIPRYDVRSTCRKAVAMTSMGEGGRTVENCMSGEDEARKEVEKDWIKIPAAERTQCVSTVRADSSPSYVELLVCLEMTRDSRKRQEDDRAKSRKPSGKT
jgi:hypothetical protein